MQVWTSHFIILPLSQAVFLLSWFTDLLSFDRANCFGNTVTHEVPLRFIIFWKVAYSVCSRLMCTWRVVKCNAPCSIIIQFFRVGPRGSKWRVSAFGSLIPKAATHIWISSSVWACLRLSDNYIVVWHSHRTILSLAPCRPYSNYFFRSQRNENCRHLLARNDAISIPLFSIVFMDAERAQCIAERLLPLLQGQTILGSFGLVNVVWWLFSGSSVKF